jgi:predicted nucleic acid-binding protein
VSRLYLLDSNVYIRAFRDPAFGAELQEFHRRTLPRLVLSAVVASELLIGAARADRERTLRHALIDPFRVRNRLVAPSWTGWQFVARIDQRIRAASGEPHAARATLVPSRHVDRCHRSRARRNGGHGQRRRFYIDLSPPRFRVCPTVSTLARRVAVMLNRPDIVVAPSPRVVQQSKSRSATSLLYVSSVDVGGEDDHRLAAANPHVRRIDSGGEPSTTLIA